MSEHDEQVSLFQILKLNETKHPELKWIFAIPNGGMRHPAVAKKLKAEGVKSGVPDICIPIPMPGSYGCFIEMKVKPNKPTPAQKECAGFLLSVGYDVVFAYSCDEALKAIEAHLGITLTK